MTDEEQKDRRPVALVVDDDEFFVSLMARALDKRGFAAEQCQSFEDVEAHMAEKDYALLITDIYMPGIGGIEGIKSLRAQRSTIPIIAMSGGWEGMLAEKTIEAAKKIGADGGISKPLQAVELDQVLDSVVPPNIVRRGSGD